jgi:nuclear pore complex protein Nup93
MNIPLLLSYLDIVRRWNREWKMPLSTVVELMSQVKDSHSFEVWRLVDQILERTTTTGALSHSCLQFAEIVQTRVRNATVAGQNVSTSMQYSNSLAQSVAAYVKLTTLSNNSVWATIYYCLRCGDAVAAWNVLETHNLGDDVSAIRTILSQWSQAQGRAQLLWDATQNLMAMTDRAARQTVTDLYERGGDDDAFYVAVLGLLSMNDPILDSESVIQTSEDYLFAWLWYVQSNEARRVELSDALRELGPSHFPDSAWGYALPLIAAQEYTSALEHLMKMQASIPAVHVALVLQEAGVLSGGDIVTRLILEHAALLQKHDPAAAVEYLIRLPDEQRRMKEVRWSFSLYFCYCR